MHGSDRVPDLRDYKRAWVGKGKPSARAKWRSSMSARWSLLKNVLDSADIVRDRDLSPTIANTRILRLRNGWNPARTHETFLPFASAVSN